MKVPRTLTVIAAWTITATMVAALAGGQATPSADPAQAVIPPAHQHNHEGLTWPPQPRGITNVVVHSNAEQDEKGRAAAKARMDHLERIAMSHPEAPQALGNQFRRITLIEKVPKKKGTVISQMVFFSRDKNATVVVDFDKEEIQTVRSIPASEYQPEITREEVAEAAALARTYFLNQGLAQADGMKAFSILAYKPAGGGFFDTRVLYVSFHQRDDAPPEFAAWVDLTNQLILKTRLEQ